jgi:3',5'-cyclic AMP phosphodiesterase CpdA
MIACNRDLSLVIRHWSIVIAVFGATARFTAAHDGPDHEHPPKKAEDAEVYKPSLVPDRIVLTWEEDPATTMSVTWRTSTDVQKGVAQIALATADPKFGDKAPTHAALSDLLTTDLGPSQYHSATFRDLKPRTKYAYRVGDGVNWSEWSHFTTASDGPEPFSFVYFGDAQNDLKSRWSRVVREAYSDAPKAAFMLHAGDLINRAESDSEWGEWFYAASHLHRMIPCVPTPGNHEYKAGKSLAGIPITSTLTHHWRPMFTLPTNGPKGLEETTYWFDYQGVRFVSLNSNVEYLVQAEWVNKLLADNPRKWTIITFHHPLFSSKEGRDNPLLRAAWQPVFDRHKVDLVLQGHDHTYARTGLMKDENVPTGVGARSPQAGTVYVVSVSGPKMYDLGRRPFMNRAAEDTQLYQIISIDGDELRYEARTAIGEVYDGFTLKKREGQPNELVDHIPNTPERLRTKPQIEAK